MGTILITLGAIGIFLALSLRKIQAEPPHVSVLTVLGRRTKIVLKEGWHLLIPWITNIIPVDIRRKDLVIAFKVQTKDGIDYEVTANVTFSPDYQERDLINYLNVGEENGIRTKLQALCEELIRHFAIQSDYKKFRKSGPKISAMLIARLTGIPEAEANDKIKGDVSIHVIEDWGIRLHLLNIRVLEPKGKMAQVLEKLAVKKREREAEIFETDTENSQAKKIVEAAQLSGQSISFEKAQRIVRDYKVAREGHGLALPGIPDALRDAILLILSGITKGKGGQNAGQKTS